MGWHSLAVPFRWVWSHPWIVTTVIMFCCVGFLVKGQDEFCGLAEGTHYAKVQELSRTYDYLGKLHGQELDLTINRFVVANLPRQEKEAHFDEAPDTCDHFGLGRPEPDPVVPARPANVDKLVRDFQHSAVRTR